MTKKIIVLPEQSKIHSEILKLAAKPISRKKYKINCHFLTNNYGNIRQNW